MKKGEYYLDLEAICDFINGDDSEKASSREIKEMYVIDDKGEMTLANKDISESQITSETGKNIRFNLFNELMDAVNLYEGDEYDDYGTKVKMNTLLTYGFLRPTNAKK